MDCKDFCFYLQGFIEMNDGGLSEDQVQKIKAKLDACLKKQSQPVRPPTAGLHPGNNGPTVYRC